MIAKPVWINRTKRVQNGIPDTKPAIMWRLGGATAS
jgi:hypothetical protein